MTRSPAQESFRRKVELLEAWAATGGAPEGEFVPRGPSQLARWVDERHGLAAWSNPNVAAPSPSGHYPDLRARFDAAVQQLARPIRQMRSETPGLKRQIQALAEQVAVLANEHRQMADELSRERQLKEIAQAQVAELRAELKRFVPIR